MHLLLPLLSASALFLPSTPVASHVRNPVISVQQSAVSRSGDLRMQFGFGGKANARDADLERRQGKRVCADARLVPAFLLAPATT